MNRTFLSLSLSTLMLLGGFRHGIGADAVAPSASEPVVAGPEGQRAFDDLSKGYVNKSGLFDAKAALADLQSKDAATSQRAGVYLLALFEQSFADESNGRSNWNPTPFFNEGPENRARDFRQALAKDFGASASSEAALPAAFWLIENDPLPDNTEAGIHVLARIHSDAANQALGHIIEAVHPNQEVLVTAIKEAGIRHLMADKISVIALEQSYRSAVRKAAVSVAAQLGETKPAPYDPLKAFSPRVLALLKVTLERIPTAVPKDAPWLDGIAQPDWNPGKPYPVHGWLLKRDQKGVTYLDVFGQTLTVSEKQVSFTPGSLPQTAKSYANLRAWVTEQAKHYHALEDKLNSLKFNSPEWKTLEITREPLYQVIEERLREMTNGMNYNAAPDDNFLNLPEMTVAAWCWQRGDLASTAAVLFPCYDASRDDRWLDWSSRDDLGNIYDIELVKKFTYERDYPAAIALASHLGGAAFDGFVYQARSKELAAQLAARSEYFTTLTLPTASEWEKIKAGLDRAGQITWLASRLKLMQCVNPGYDEVQFASAYPDERVPQGAPEVINPYNELLQLNLTPTDLLTLAPFAADKDYSLSYTFFEQQTSGRGLCRVAYAVGELINSVAGHALVHQTEDGIAFDNSKPSTIIIDLQAWVAVHHDDTPDKLIAQTLSTSTDWKTLNDAAVQALKIHHVEVLSLLANRLDSLPSTSQYDQAQQANMVHLLYGSHAPMVDHARQWIKSPNAEARLWASLILIRDGDTAHDEGFNTLEPLLTGYDAERRYIMAARTLLASSSPRARQVAAAVFQKIDPRQHQGDDLQLNWMYKLYFVASRRECLDFLIKMLDDYTVDPNSGNATGPPPYSTTNQVFYLGTWGRHMMESPKTVPEIQKYRAKLKNWLTAQFALIEQDKPSDIHVDGAEYKDQFEQYLNPTPVRRHTAEEAAETQD
jgi:hypothetical protein